MRRSIVALALILSTHLATRAAEECALSKLEPNPDVPACSGTGRIDASVFFKRFPEHELYLVPCDLVPNNDFGIAKPGDTFGNRWLVAAKGEKVGINHKSVVWPKGIIVCNVNGKETRLHPDIGCGCGGTADYYWTVPFNAPPGKHTIRITWECPQYTKQKLEQTYTVTIENPDFGKTEDPDIAKAQSEYGKDKIVVLQQGREINGKIYEGCKDTYLGFGGYEGDKTDIIHPRDRRLDIGFWTVNPANMHYCRGMLRFDLEPLTGKKIKLATLKLSIRPNQRYVPSEMKVPMPIHALLKDWKEGDKVCHVDERGLNKDLPTVCYQSYPIKWEKPLAGGPADRGPQMATLVPDKKHLVHGARADVTQMAQDWLSGKTPNYGFIIGKDMPEELLKTHPGKNEAAFKALYPEMIPFFSKDEPDESDLRPRLIVVLE